MKCEIIQDLLPNYIDGLTSPITDQEIERHLSECSICQEYFQEMSKNITASTQTKKDIDPFLKIKQSNLRKMILAIFLTAAFIGLGIDVWHSYWNNSTSIFSDETTISCIQVQDLTKLVFTPTETKTRLSVGYVQNEKVGDVMPLVTLHVAKYHEREDDNRILQGSYDMIFLDENSYIDLDTFPSITEINEDDVIAVQFNEKTILINVQDLYDGKVTIE